MHTSELKGPRDQSRFWSHCSLQQEEGLEALETGELEEGIRDLEATVQDPVQRMLLLQVQQLSLLTRQQQQQKQQDPISAALSGGGGESSSTASAGIKGCMAREAFIRLMEDLPKFSSVVMTNAARELGIELSSVGPGLMRDYIEKRCPLGDNRHLTQQAYLWAFAWETGFRSNKIELMAIASRGLVYIDQTAMDFNKTKFELASHGPARICQKNRLPNTLSPFSRLANASWVGANVAFMKDLDFHESKMKATSGTTKGVGAQEDGPEEAAPKEALEAKEKEGQCWHDHRRVDCLDGAKCTPSPSPLVPSLPGCSTSGRGCVALLSFPVGRRLGELRAAFSMECRKKLGSSATSQETEAARPQSMKPSPGSTARAVSFQFQLGAPRW